MTILEVITAAVADLSENGFDSMERVDYWSARIRQAAREAMTPEADLQDLLQRNLKQVYERQIEQGAILKTGVPRYTVDKLRPQLRDELSRRLMASAQLIKQNRERMVAQTEQRWVGWATSVPKGGSDEVDKVETKKVLRKAIASLPFEERRVAIDQGHKFAASLQETVALGSNAIAAMWHSHWRQPGYDYRVDHKERDQHVYAIKGNWAIKRGLMTKGAGYTDEMTKPAEEPYCRCRYQYIYNLRKLPEEMLTDKGREELAEARRKIAGA